LRLRWRRWLALERNLHRSHRAAHGGRDVSWELRPWLLLLGKLAAHIAVTRGDGNLEAEVQLGFGQRVTVRHFLADLPLDPALLPGVPADLHGRAHLDLALAQFEHGIITELQGRIEARDLEDRSGGATPLGSYVVTFSGGPGEPTGKLRDLNGPLAVEGTLRLTRQPGFELEGLVAARAGAAPELLNNIRYLGSRMPPAGGRSRWRGRSDPLRAAPERQAASTPLALAVCVAMRSISAGERQS